MRSLSLLIILVSSIAGTSAQSVEVTSDVFGNCGARCLFLVHSATSEPDLRLDEFLEEHPECREETISLAELSSIADSMGINNKVIQFDPNSSLPPFEHLIAKLANESHFVILSSKSDGGWIYHDFPNRPRLAMRADFRRLSGEAMGINFKRRLNYPRWLGIGLILVITVTLIATVQKWGRSRTSQFTGALVLAASTTTLAGCETDRDGANRPDPRFRFSEPVVDLGDVSLTKEAIPFELTLFSTANDPPTIEASCGCVTFKVEQFDNATSGWPIAFKLQGTKLGTTRINITARSSISDDVAKASVKYEVVALISAALDKQKLNLDSESGCYVGAIQITENPLRLSPQISMKFDAHQAQAGVGYLVQRNSPTEYQLYLFPGEATGCQHALIQIKDDNANLIGSSIRCQWGEPPTIESAVRRVWFSNGPRHASEFVLHGNATIARVRSIRSSLGEIHWSSKLLQESVARIEVELRRTSGQTDGDLIVAFDDGDELTIPASIEK